MNKKEKLERLLSLSRRLAALADQERWGDWEAVAEQKEALYGDLEPVSPVSAPTLPTTAKAARRQGISGSTTTT